MCVSKLALYTDHIVSEITKGQLDKILHFPYYAIFLGGVGDKVSPHFHETSVIPQGKI